MAIVMAEFHTMPLEQRIGAHRMISLISNELCHMQDEKLRLDTRTILKTLDDIQINLMEDIGVESH